MIAFATPTFDLNGSVTLKKTSKSDIETIERRVTRTATLDGGVEIADMGFTHGDRTLNIRARKESLETEAAIKYLLVNYPIVVCTTRDGVFHGAIERMNRNQGELNVTFLIQEKISGE